MEEEQVKEIVVKDNKLVRKLKEAKEAEQHNVDGDAILKASKQLLIGAGDRDVEVLDILGMNHIQNYQKELTSDIVRTKMAEEIYSRDCFTGKMLKNLCNKYYLKVLPADFYKGALTADLPRIIDEFCKKHEIDMRAESNNFFILAPIEMLQTTKNVPIAKIRQSKDPILLYRAPERTGSDRYTHRKVTEGCVLTQVHNWGSDFSEMRRFRVMLNTTQLEEADLTPLGLTIIGTILLIAGIIVGLFGLPIIAALAGFLSLIPFYLALGPNYIDTLWNDSSL